MGAVAVQQDGMEQVEFSNQSQSEASVRCKVQHIPCSNMPCYWQESKRCSDFMSEVDWTVPANNLSVQGMPCGTHVNGCEACLYPTTELYVY